MSSEFSNESFVCVIIILRNLAVFSSSSHSCSSFHVFSSIASLICRIHSLAQQHNTIRKKQKPANLQRVRVFELMALLELEIKKGNENGENRIFLA